MCVNSFESVSVNCVGLKSSANSFRPQLPSFSSTTASLSSGLSTTTAYWRVYRHVSYIGYRQFYYSARCPSHYIVGHHPIMQPICCETTYIGCVFPADRLEAVLDHV